MDKYEPMSLASLAHHLNARVDERVRWKLVWEFLEEYRWEPADIQIGMALKSAFCVADSDLAGDP